LREAIYYPLPLWKIERSETHRVERSEIRRRARERGNIISEIIKFVIDALKISAQ
jgi:hypothetical protein